LHESPTGQRGARLLRCPIQRIESLFGRLLKLPDEILVYLYLVGPDGDHTQCEYGKQTCGLTPTRDVIELMIRYGQFCPVAKTAEIFGDRWSPLIIRELCYGPRSYGDFLAAIPLISRTMLSQRLKELEAADVVHATAKEKGRGYRYTLTAAGEAFRPMIEMMAQWGLQWGQGLVGPDDLDSQLLIWGIRQHIDHEDITAQEFVLRFDFRGIPKGSRTPRHWWLLIRQDEIEVCLKDPRQNLDVMIEADLAAFTKVWTGYCRLEEALAQGLVTFRGTGSAIAQMRRMLKLTDETVLRNRGTVPQ
jgi:DNA-binding HxlR family transcriptional regulator